MAGHRIIQIWLTLAAVLVTNGFKLECGNKPADLFFLLDSSSSIHIDSFTEQLNFVKKVASSFNYGTVTRIGVSTFAYQVIPQIKLGEFTDLESFNNAVSKIRQVIGGTDTHKAIKAMRTDGFKTARPGIPHIGIIITDGDSSEPKKTASEALLAKEAGITLFAIGVGRQVNFPQLRDIASSPEYAFRVNNYEALESIKEKLAIKTCEVTTLLPPTTTTTPKPTTTLPPIIEDCVGRYPLDIVFSIPEHAGVEEAAKYIDFIKEVSTAAKISPKQVQMGMSKQIYDQRKEVLLNEATDGNTLREKLEAIKPPGDHLGRVLEHIRKTSLKEEQGAREEAVKIAILIEDSRLADPDKVQKEAVLTKTAGIHVWVIGVGSQIQADILKNVASKDAYYHRDSPEEFKPEFRNQMAGEMCKASTGGLKFEDFLL